MIGGKVWPAAQFMLKSLETHIVRNNNTVKALKPL